MLRVFGICLIALLLSPLASAKECVSCHDFGPESPVHNVLAGSHGQSEDGIQACENCHGPSESHGNSPTQVSPDVSFGPRWTATIADQDAQCLACHEENTAAHWKDALHMVNDLTCITCHDIHTDVDTVLQDNGQVEVCSVCHKEQKAGIHALTDKTADNPQCSSCHNPHDHESAATAMLANRSEGCIGCHDLVQLAADPQASPKAVSYHKVMTQPDRSCLDCHQGIAHAPADSVNPVLDVSQVSRSIKLFAPGQSDSEWLLTEHPGSQPLRQGKACQQCHRGEEVAMGNVLASNANIDASRDLWVGFSLAGDDLVIDIKWRGEADDQDIAFMWGDGGNDAFARGGCFAACHSDMPGMTRDRGQQTGKYLMVSRSQERRIGQPAMVLEQADLDQLISQGDYAELWRIQLADGGKAEVATVLDEIEWLSTDNLDATANFADGTWSVSIRRNREAGAPQKTFSASGRYTFGIALHGADNSGGGHWISLPMTLGLDSEDTFFRAK